jgi:predicted transcriptional regulator of viral defense system
LPQIGKALYQARTNIDFEKLLDYCKRFDSQAVIKRLGFLLELLKIGEPIIEKLQDLKTDSYILLDTEMEKEGKSLSRWSIGEIRFLGIFRQLAGSENRQCLKSKAGARQLI